MAKKQAPPITEQEFRTLIHQIIRRMIFVGLGFIVLGLVVIGLLALWKG